jgi:uncharacterized protein YigA (DUF484 family)
MPPSDFAEVPAEFARQRERIAELQAEGSVRALGELREIAAANEALAARLRAERARLMEELESAARVRRYLDAGTPASASFTVLT